MYKSDYLARKERVVLLKEQSQTSSITDVWRGSKYTHSIQFNIQFMRALWSLNKPTKVDGLRFYEYTLKGQKNI